MPDPVAVLHPDTAGVVAVQISVVGFVSVERNVLDRHAGDVLAAEQWEEAFHLRFAHQPYVLAQTGVELEPVPVAGHQRTLDYLGAAVRHVFHSEANPIPDLKPARIGERNLLVEPV